MDWYGRGRVAEEASLLVTQRRVLAFEVGNALVGRRPASQFLDGVRTHRHRGHKT
jgi:hypothetical protein